jgi:hypothetical protein
MSQSDDEPDGGRWLEQYVISSAIEDCLLLGMKGKNAFSSWWSIMERFYSDRRDNPVGHNTFRSNDLVHRQRSAASTRCCS